MSSDKLQALHNTVSEILSEPPAPPTFFDEDPGVAALAGERLAKASDRLPQGTATATAHFGKLAAGERTATLRTREAHVAHDTANASLCTVRQTIAEEVQAGLLANAVRQQSAKQEPGAVRHEVNSQAASSLRRWGLVGVAGVLLAGVGAIAFNWLGSSGDNVKPAPSQPAAIAQSVPAATESSDLTPLVQAMSRDLAGLGKEIEQLKAERASMVRENANLVEQLKAGQEKLAVAVAALSGQLKAGQELLARDKANADEQIKGVRDQLDRVSSQVSDQAARSRISPPRPAAPRPDAAAPRPEASAPRRPAPPLASAQVSAQPRNERPRPPATARPPAPTPAPR